MRYQGQDFLTAPARQSPELWRFALGLALVVACYLTLGHSYFTLLAEMVTPQDWPLLAAEIDRGSSPRGMLAILASFGFIIIALGLVLIIYGRMFTERRRRQLARLASVRVGEMLPSNSSQAAGVGLA